MPGDPQALVRAGEAQVDGEIADLPEVRATWLTKPGKKERIYVLELGHASAGHPPLLLFHGIGEGGMRDFYPILRELGRERHVVAVDLPGFGESDRQDDDLTPDRTVEDMASVATTLGLARTDLLGHSSGAALALLYAHRYPERVRRTVLVGVCGVLRPETLLRSQLHENLNDMREKAPVGAKIVEKTGDAFVNAMSLFVPSATSVGKSRLIGHSPSIQLATTLLDYDFAPAIFDMHAPTLLVWGTKDDVAPVRVAHLLEDRLPRSELAFLEGAAHVPMEDKPRELARMVTSYLDQPVKPRREDAPFRVPERVARCEHQAGMTLQGDYDEIVADDCKELWLNRVRARRITLKDSQVRLDHVYVQEGLSAKESTLVITGGELDGKVPLELSGGKHDVAGTLIRGDQASTRADEAASILFSVSKLESQKGARFVHDERKLDEGTEL